MIRGYAHFAVTTSHSRSLRRPSPVDKSRDKRTAGRGSERGALAFRPEHSSTAGCTDCGRNTESGRPMAHVDAARRNRGSVARAHAEPERVAGSRRIGSERVAPALSYRGNHEWIL